MIKAVFLDFEGVVTTNGGFLHTVLFPQLREFVPREVFDIRYTKAKRNEITFEEFIEGVPKQKLFGCIKQVKYNKGAKETLTKLRKKFALFLASNHVPVYFEKELEVLNAAKYFKDIFVSYKLGTAKPDKEFFELILKKSGFLPNESVFVDDAKLNLKMAKEVGFVTIWFDNKRTDDIRNDIAFVPDYEICDMKDLQKIIQKIKN